MMIDEIKSLLDKLNSAGVAVSNFPRGKELRVGQEIIKIDEVTEKSLEWQKQHLPKILDELKATVAVQEAFPDASVRCVVRSRKGYSTPHVLSIRNGLAAATSYGNGFDEKPTYGTLFLETQLTEVQRIIDEVKAGSTVTQHDIVEWPGVVEIAPYGELWS